MPLIPNFVERRLFLTFNQAPAVGLDLWAGPAFWTVLAGIRLKLFDTLDGGPQSPADLAAALGSDERGTRILLDTLAGLGYVEARNGRYRNSAMTRRWLLESGDVNFSPIFQYWGVIMEHFMPRLEKSLRGGEVPVNFYEWVETQPDASRHFQEGMVNLARYVAGDVVKLLTLPPGANRLLDVGGGHAMFSVALCKAHPHLRADVLDLPAALTVGRETVARQGLADRVTPVEGSFLTGDLGSGYDMVLVFNIVHGFTPEENVALFRKVAAALNPGGRIAVLEQLAGGAPMPTMNAIVNILSVAYYHLLGGQAYTYEDISGWLAEAGFANVRRQNVLKAGSALVTASV